MANKEFKTKSLCLVCYGDNGYYLIRLADITGKNYLVPFYQDEHDSKNFSNRNTWYITDQNLPNGISEGSIGIWNLSSIPNINDSSKDYIKTSYSSTDSPIEIYYFKEANTCSEVIKLLKTGINYKPISRRVFFGYCPKKGIFQGVLVPSEYLFINNEKLTLNITAINSLPVYFMNNSLFNLLNFKLLPSRFFYNYLDLGEETDRILVKSEMEIIREIIIKRATWPIMKQRGINKNDWKQFKDFINDINDSDFYEEIARNCKCSDNIAKTKVNEFINTCDKYIEGKDIDTEVIASVLKRNTELNTICMKEAANFWEQEHQDKIKKINEEFQNILKEAENIKNKKLKEAENEIKINKEKLKDEEKRLRELLSLVNQKKEEIKKQEEVYNARLYDYKNEEERIKKAIYEQKKKLEKLEIECSEKAKLGEDVKSKILNRIKEAKQDIASFMSEYTFLNNIITNTSNNISNINNIETNNHLYFKNSEIIEEEVTKYSDLIGYLKENLISAGVDEKQANVFATFLFVLLKNTNAFILSGPNSEAIANAISQAYFNETLTVFNCFGDYNNESLKKLKEISSNLILIKNPFYHGWLENIIDLINQNDKYYILSCSFSDDLLLESKNLFNYTIPIITEFVVDELPENVCFSCKKTDNYNDYENVAKKPLMSNLFKDFGMSKLTTNTYQSILSDLHSIYDSNDVLPYYMYLLVPYAFVTNNNKLVAERIKNETRLSKDIKENLLSFLGIKDE